MPRVNERALLVFLVLTSPALEYQHSGREAGIDQPQNAQAESKSQQNQSKEGKKEERPKAAEQEAKFTVMDGNGQPVFGATVSFNGPTPRSGTTVKDGSYVFKGTAGDYSVSVTSGAKMKTLTVKIANNRMEPATVILD